MGCDPAGASAPGTDAVGGPRNLHLAALDLRHQPRDGTAVAGYHDGLATLDLIEQLGQVGLGLGRRYFSHELARIGRFDWSKNW
jgi:hypothetical protein